MQWMQCQNFDFNLRRDHQKISYERPDYEFVDEKSPKNYEKKSGSKGLSCYLCASSIIYFADGTL